VFVVTGPTDEALRDAVVATKQQIAFYGSTPAYRPVLEHHGWGELQEELAQLVRQDRWDAMGDAIPDDVLHAFAIVGEPEAIAPELTRRYDGLADRVSFYTTYPCDATVLDNICQSLL
jgi:alkanesulfonate monooxygenase SsuD/methylene tetrahydromethanopterin reductase-like flavin-dependent oxidoreductase (luciferase family)